LRIPLLLACARLWAGAGVVAGVGSGASVDAVGPGIAVQAAGAAAAVESVVPDAGDEFVVAAAAADQNAVAVAAEEHVWVGVAAQVGAVVAGGDVLSTSSAMQIWHYASVGINRLAARSCVGKPVAV
jgi:hypothetical protein